MAKLTTFWSVKYTPSVGQKAFKIVQNVYPMAEPYRNGNGLIDVVLILVKCMKSAIDCVAINGIVLPGSITKRDFKEIVAIVKPYATLLLLLLFYFAVISNLQHFSSLPYS